MKLPLRWLLGASLVGLAGAGVLPGTASAHTPYAADSCAGLEVSMVSYSAEGTPNKVTVTVDGSVVIDTWFGESFHQFVPWSASTTHEWIVVVDGLTDDGDATLSGTQEACDVTTSTSTSISTPTTVDETTTTAPAATSTTLVGGDGGSATTTSTIADTSTTSTTSTTTTSTLVGGDGGEITTTTEVAGLGPVPTSLSPAGGSVGSVLPTAGGGLITAWVAAVLAIAGAAMALLAVRRRAV